MSARRRNYDDEYDEPTAPPSLDEMDTQLPGHKPAYRGTDEDVTDVAFDSSSRIDETVLDDQFIRPKHAVEAILWVKEGNRRGSWYPISHDAVIGRDEGNVVLDDDKVSGTHAKIAVENGQYFIWPFASKNGTYVKGKRIRGATRLEENDRVKIGDTVFIVKLLDARKKPVKKTTAKRKPTAPRAKSKSTSSGTRRKASSAKK